MCQDLGGKAGHAVACQWLAVTQIPGPTGGVRVETENYSVSSGLGPQSILHNYLISLHTNFLVSSLLIDKL